MVLFGFGSKKEVKIGKGEIPVEKAKNLLIRGFSEVEVIDALRKEGYSPEEIDKALMQAVPEIKNYLPSSSNPTVNTTSTLPQPIQQETLQPLYQNVQTPSVLVQEAAEKSYENPATQNYESSEKSSFEEILPSLDYQSLEEYLDYLINEKITEFNKGLIETNLKFKDIEEKLITLKEELENVEKGTKNEINKILDEIKINRESIKDLAIKVDALNRTLKELLPSLVESIRLLGEIVQKLKA